MTDDRPVPIPNALLCIAPLLILGVASVTAYGGPSPSVRGLGSGVLLFAASTVGILSTIIGVRRLVRVETSPTSMARLLKIALFIVGCGAMLLNGVFFLFAGLNLASMAFVYFYFRQ